MKELKPEMTLSEVGKIFVEAEGHVWSEYIGGFPEIDGEHGNPGKVTLEDIAPHCGFIVYVGRGNSEGIYLDIEALGEEGVRNHAFTCKTLASPDDDEAWDECWLSAGRIARALEEIWW